jgi:hypothetical protein
MDELTERRMARNEEAFRRVNDEIAERAVSESATRYVCECADAHCSAVIRLSADDYADVRSAPNRFFVRPGHEQPEIEDVVERHDEYLVVEKRSVAGENA